jgi:hypothetical protein
MTFLVLTTKDVLATSKNDFLERLKSKWRMKYGNEGSGFPAKSKTAEFGPEISNLISIFNSDRAKKSMILKKH